MAPLPPFQLPLSSSRPPSGFGWAGRDFSALSTTTAFRTGLDQRDQFLGMSRCVVCGDYGRTIEHCHIIMDSEPDTVSQRYLSGSPPHANVGQWTKLKERGWIPEKAKDAPSHEPRDGIIMCKSHHGNFDSYDFFIRFFPHVSLICL